jgi:hypothetical protein
MAGTAGQAAISRHLTIVPKVCGLLAEKKKLAPAYFLCIIYA